jgi:hypothetical protein
MLFTHYKLRAWLRPRALPARGGSRRQTRTRFVSQT